MQEDFEEYNTSILNFIILINPFLTMQKVSHIKPKNLGRILMLCYR